MRLLVPQLLLLMTVCDLAALLLSSPSLYHLCVHLCCVRLILNFPAAAPATTPPPPPPQLPARLVRGACYLCHSHLLCC